MRIARKLLFIIGVVLCFSLSVKIKANTNVYRLYNPSIKKHLFTKDLNETKTLSNNGWSLENSAWKVSEDKGDNVYRIYNSELKTHLYTKDLNEYTTLSKKGWRQEGIAFKSYGEIPIYRLYNSSLKYHLYTKDKNEYDTLAKNGWRPEGIAFYSIATEEKQYNKQNVSISIKTQEDLDNYLQTTGTDLTGDKIEFSNNETVVFPSKTFSVDNGFLEFFIVSAKGSVIFNNSVFLIGDGGLYVRTFGEQYNREFSNFTIYGTTGTSPDFTYQNQNYYNPYTNSYKNGAFAVAMFHTNNIKFSNLEINNAQSLNGHVFDVVGCNNVLFDNVSIKGSALQKELGQEKIDQLALNYGHAVFSESIQIDSSVEGSLGDRNPFDGKFPYFYLWKGQKYDGRASKNITITNSKFVSYNGPTGLSLIRGISQNVKKYGAGIGGHSVGNEPYTGIIIKNVTFEGTISTSHLNNEFAPIKFLTVEPTVFTLTGKEKTNFILSSNIRKGMNIFVNNVTFENTKKQGYYNKSGIYESNSVWLAYY